MGDLFWLFVLGVLVKAPHDKTHNIGIDGWRPPRVCTCGTGKGGVHKYECELLGNLTPSGYDECDPECECVGECQR